MDSNGYNALTVICQEHVKRPCIDLTLRLIPCLPSGSVNQKPSGGQLRGQAPLHIVSSGKDVEDRRHEVIAALIEAKADMEDRELNGRTPLLPAAGAA